MQLRIEDARDMFIAYLKISGVSELETRLMISSSMFYYGSMIGFIVSLAQIYTNVVYGIALYRAKKQAYVIP